MPRHNVYASVIWDQYISKIRMNAFPSVEVEYHSKNFGSYLNPIDLEDYFLLHLKVSVRIKSFNFYYTMENVTNVKYQTVYAYPSARRVWWGIRWIFLD
jgi:outer membrane cobalamin receptor